MIVVFVATSIRGTQEESFGSKEELSFVRPLDEEQLVLRISRP